jgi:hypothetical protein
LHLPAPWKSSREAQPVARRYFWARAAEPKLPELRTGKERPLPVAGKMSKLGARDMHAPRILCFHSSKDLE